MMQRVTGKIKKRIVPVALLCVLLVCTCLGGCGEVTPETKRPAWNSDPVVQQQSGVQAENDHFRLTWDNDRKCVLFEDKTTDTVWSTIPYDFYKEDSPKASLDSPLTLQYYSGDDYNLYTIKAYNAVLMEGRVESKAIENGVEVTYYFDALEIAIPVEYRIAKDHFVVATDSSRFVEGSNKIFSVSIAPYLCSAPNDTEDAYLFVPAGSGALLYTDKSGTGTRTYSAPLYGKDVSQILTEDRNEEEAARLPVYGVKNGSQALLSIITDGAESCAVTAEAAGKPGYSGVYSTFYVHGDDVFEQYYGFSITDVRVPSEDMSNNKLSVSYYPLTGDKASYVGMADRYREYLIARGELSTPVRKDEHAYSVSFLGGLNVKKIAAGLPYWDTETITTYQQAQTFLAQAAEKTGAKPVANLVGFGESGLSKGELAGGYDFLSGAGSDSDRQGLAEFCEGAGIPLFTDYEMLFFSESGGGFNKTFDGAKSASIRTVEKYEKTVAIANDNEELPSYTVLRRDALSTAFNKLLSATEKQAVGGVSLFSFGKTAYSDYNAVEYIAKSGMPQQVASLLAQVKEAGHSLALSDANVYAAVYADHLFDVALDNGGADALDESVPFYQMVFRGYVPLYSRAVNLADVTNDMVLDAVESGVGLGFTAYATYDPAFAGTQFAAIYGSSFAYVSGLIEKLVPEYNRYFEEIKGCTIVDHTLLSDGVTKTVFSNGKAVYVNRSHEEVTVEGQTVPAENYVLAKGSAE